MIVGLVSTWKEGRLAVDAVRSLLACCQTVRVLEGPIGEPSEGGIDTDWTQFKREPRVIVTGGAWDSDAEKRSALLDSTRRFAAPTWGVIVDADEILVSGEYLPSLIEYRQAQADVQDQIAINVPLRLVEADGSIGLITARVLRLDLIERWLISSYHIQLRSGVEVSLPNAYPLKCGEPDRQETEETTGLQIRRPHQGEPHILHRSILRAPDRDVERQSSAEGTMFDKLVKESGLDAAHGEHIKDERVALWLPT